MGQHPDAFPPIVIHVTDGMATDGNPEVSAQNITDLRTSDGSALLFNLHLSEASTYRPTVFPDSEELVPPIDEFAIPLFRMSSVLPESSRERADELSYKVNQNSRGYVYNADLVSLVDFLEIGTRAASNLQ